MARTKATVRRYLSKPDAYLGGWSTKNAARKKLSIRTR